MGRICQILNLEAVAKLNYLVYQCFRSMEHSFSL